MEKFVGITFYPLILLHHSLALSILVLFELWHGDDTENMKQDGGWKKHGKEEGDEDDGNDDGSLRMKSEKKKGERALIHTGMDTRSF